MTKKMTKKQEKVWAYKVKHPMATTRKIALETNSSVSYVHKLMSKIGTPREVLAQPPVDVRQVTRGSILDTAKQYVTEDRASEHGDMEDNFQRISDYWNVHLGLINFIKVEDVAVMMALLKVARIHSNPKHPDNWVDACGYMACGGEIAGNH